jgi:4'-phosphopantetheinyl transferase
MTADEVEYVCRSLKEIAARRIPGNLCPRMLGDEMPWLCTPVEAHLRQADVQVCAAWLDVSAERLTALQPSLAGDEQARAERFRLPRDRARFVAGRGLLREILGSRIGAEPRMLQFCYSAKGKPSLGGAYANHELQFNMAHSGALAVFAISRHGPIGVDVEQVRPVPDLLALSARCFTERERSQLDYLTGDKQTLRFFELWTRKEAWLKATGEGITGALACIEVLGAAGKPASCRGPQQGSSNPAFHLHDLAPAPGFVGALAVSPPPRQHEAREQPAFH